MSERAGDLLREEMDYMGGVRVSAVEAKQQEIVDIVRNLEDSGELDLSAADEDEELLQ